MIGIINNILNKQWTHAISTGSFTKQLTSVYFKGAIIRLFGNPPLICALLLSLKRIKDWYLKQNENRLLLRENINAELQLLKAQIHPHFLFNTLNNIYFFILSEPVKAEDLITKLENLLYYMINECNVPAVPLDKEINMINDYFELEKVRYNDLDIELVLTGDYTNKMIAPLLMIPFIENSFKHGTSKMLRDPWIKLFIQADEEMLHFTLANNKPAGKIIDKKHGIGLSNVKKRLAILHPEKHYLTIEPTENTFTINMQIPLEQANKTVKNTDAAIYNL
jgi:LytS/YehU family sensor histidine kinase